MKEVKLTNEQLQKLAGTYEISEGVNIEITLNNDQLFAKWHKRNTYPIFAESETEFFFKVADAQIQFGKNGDGDTKDLLLLLNGNKITAKRIE